MFSQVKSKTRKNDNSQTHLKTTDESEIERQQTEEDLSIVDYTDEEATEGDKYSSSMKKRLHSTPILAETTEKSKLGMTELESNEADCDLMETPLKMRI